MRFSLLLSLLLLTACGPSPRRIVLGNGNTAPQVQPHQPAVTTGGGSQGTPPASAGGSPIDRLNMVNAHLESQGFRRVGSAVLNRNLAPGSLVAHAVNAQSGHCYVAVALGADGSDVNMVMVDPRGQTVAHNVAPDANPWVRLCASQNGRHIARVQMASGGGEHYFAYYEGQGDPQLASVLGGDSAPVAPANLQPDSETQQRIAALDARLGQSNYRRVADVVGYQVEQSSTKSVSLQLTAGYCYSFASVGGQGARDTDVALRDSSGSTLTQDRSTAVDAVVEYCPSSTGRFELVATMYSGSGPLFIAGWSRAENQAATNNNAGNNNAVIDTSTTTSGLAETFALIHADITARGYESYGSDSAGELAESESQDFPLELEGGKCYAIVAQGDGSVRDLDLLLRDRRGRELDRDVDTANRAIVRVCPEQSGAYTMAVRMADGHGQFRYQAYRWPRGTRGPFGLNGLIYVRLGEVTALLGQEGYQPSSVAAPGQGNLRRQGATANHNIDLPAGCVSVLVVGGDGVHDLDVQLSQGRNTLTGDDSRNAFPNVRHCADTAGEYRLSVEASAGSGRYYYQIFERPR